VKIDTMQEARIHMHWTIEKIYSFLSRHLNCHYDIHDDIVCCLI